MFQIRCAAQKNDINLGEKRIRRRTPIFGVDVRWPKIDIKREMQNEKRHWNSDLRKLRQQDIGFMARS